MQMTANKRLLGWILILGGSIATITITPTASYDPINVPKLVVVALFGSIAGAVLFTTRGFFTDARYRLVLIFSGLFLVDMVVVLFASGGNMTQQIFGTNGRNTGLIAYLSFALLLLAGVVASGAELLKRVVYALLVVGALSSGYGVLQANKLDPAKWTNPYSPVLGFLGNPNFQASFMGMVLVIAFGWIFASGLKWVYRGALVVFIGVGLYVINESQSQQGFLVFVAGAGVVLYLVVRSNSKLKVLSIPYLIAAIVGFGFVVAGILSTGPLSFIHKDSVSYRGDYWRAGWKMTLGHPIFGVGMDSFGDWYRRSRDLTATVRRGPDVTSNAAHNTLIDLSSNGGFPLVIIYLLIIGLVMYSAFKVIRRSKSFDAAFTAIFAAWVAYFAQSIISLNQIGLAVWGWILSGLVIGYEIHTRPDKEVVSQAVTGKQAKGRVTKVQNRSSISPNTTIAIFAGIVVGLILGLPAYIADANFRTALASGNSQLVIDAAYKWPQTSARMVQAAGILRDNKFEAEGLKIALDATKFAPDTFDTWRTVTLMPTVGAADKEVAYIHMRELDPLNTQIVSK